MGVEASAQRRDGHIHAPEGDVRLFDVDFGYAPDKRSCTA